QLHLQGTRVGLLAMFDSGTPDYPKLLPGKTVFRSKFDHAVRRIQHHCDSLKMLGARQRVTYIMNRAEKVRRLYYRMLNDRYRRAGRAFYALRRRPVPKSFIQIEDKISRAARKYVPQVYPGKATLFRSAVQPRGIYLDPTLGWDGLVAGGLEIYEVPGQHAAI